MKPSFIEVKEPLINKTQTKTKISTSQIFSEKKKKIDNSRVSKNVMVLKIILAY